MGKVGYRMSETTVDEMLTKFDEQATEVPDGAVVDVTVADVIAKMQQSE